MTGRRLRIFSRVVFAICGLVSLVTGVPYAMLQGVSLPYQSEWVIFVAGLAVIGVFSLAAAIVPRSWMRKMCHVDSDDSRIFSALLKMLCRFAVISYLVAVFAYLAPHTWNLNPQLMLALCPMYLVRMTFDPSPLLTFFLLAPMNAAVYGGLGLILGYAWLACRSRAAAEGPC